MFEIEKTGPNRLDMMLSGKLETEDMTAALDQLETLSADITDGKIFYDIKDFHMPNFGALQVEMSRMPALFRLIGKFSRCAVLSDESWLRTLSELEARLIPGLEIKAFPRDQRAEAESWLEAG